MKREYIYIGEIVKTKQGEGKYVGRDIVLVRVMGCNLRCSFCDTKYTWKKTDGKRMTARGIMREIVKKSSEWDGMIKKRVVNTILITGGEPALYFENREFLKLLEIAKNWNYEIHMETNGLIEIPEKVEKYLDFVAISPKIFEYTLKYLRLKREGLMKLNVEHIWKFAISGVNDLRRLIDFLIRWSKYDKDIPLKNEEIYVMPITGNGIDYEAQLKWIKRNLEIVKSAGVEKVYVSERRHIKEGWK